MVFKSSVASLVYFAMIVLIVCDPSGDNVGEPWVAETYTATGTASDAELTDYPVSVALDNPDIPTSAPVCINGDQPGHVV